MPHCVLLISQALTSIFLIEPFGSSCFCRIIHDMQWFFGEFTTSICVSPGFPQSFVEKDKIVKYIL